MLKWLCFVAINRIEIDHFMTCAAALPLAKPIDRPGGGQPMQQRPSSRHWPFVKTKARPGKFPGSIHRRKRFQAGDRRSATLPGRRG